jgi:hypothetical protein
MHDETMTIEEFEALLDRYGGVIERWPSESARAARALLAISDAARVRLKQAGALETLLSDAMPAFTLTTGALRSRILAEIGRRATRPRWWSWFMEIGGVRRPIAIAVALIPLSLGFAIGIGYEPAGLSDEFVSNVNLLAFTDYEGYGDAN